MPETVAWGLDIGQAALHAVKLERGGNGEVILSDAYFASLDTHIDDPAYNDKVAEALQLFVASKKVGRTPVVISLPGYTTLFREFTLPAVGGSRLAEIVSYEAKQLIPYPLEEVQWDFMRLREDDETGEIEIALVCCRRDIIAGQLAALDEAGVNVEALQVGPIALANYVLFDTPPEDVALILDCGARTTDFVILSEGSFWLRSISVSGTDLTRALMSKFSIPYEEAETLKAGMADSKQAGRVFRVVEPTLRSLAGEVTRSIGFYKSRFRGASLQEVICAGNTFLLEGVDQFMADNLGYGTRTLGLPETIQVAPLVNTEMIEENRQVLGTATGLALQGLGLAQFEITLLPEERRFKKLIRKKEKYAWIAAAFVLVAVIMNYISTESQKPHFVAAIENIRRIEGKAQEAKKAFHQVGQGFAPEKKRNEALTKVESTRSYMARACDELRQVIEQINIERRRLSQNMKVDDYPLTRELRTTLYEDAIERFSLEQTKPHEMTWVYIDEETPGDEPNPEVKKHLEVQIDRRLRQILRRRGLFFINQEIYKVLKARNQGTPEVPKWTIADEPAVNLTSGSGNDGRSRRAPAETGGLQAIPVPAYDKELTDGVKITLRGFCVTSSGAEAVSLRDSLNKARHFTILNDSFSIRSNVPKNKLNLPALKNPKRIVWRRAVIQGKPEDIIDEGPIDYAVYAEESVIEFSADVLYIPPETSLPAPEKEVERAVEEARQLVAEPAEPAPEPETSPATTPTEPAAPAEDEDNQ